MIKKILTHVLCGSICMLLTISLLGLEAPVSHAASSHPMYKAMAMKVVPIGSAEEFQQKLQAPGLVVVLFFEPWCVFCQKVTPTYLKYSNQFASATYLSVVFDALPKVATQQGVTKMPTFVFYKNGKELQRMAGTDTAQLQKMITENL